MKSMGLFSRRVVWITALSLALAWLLAFNLMPILRGGFGWVWPYDPVLDLHRIGPLFVGLILYVPVALWLLRQRSAAGLLAWATVGSIGLACAAVYIRGDVLYRLFSITASGRDGGWLYANTRFSDLTITLRHWPQFMRDSVVFSTHMGVSPPGIVLVYYAATAILQAFPVLAHTLAYPLQSLPCTDPPLSVAQSAAAWLGILTPVWSGLTILPLYQLGRSVFGREPARWSIAWWPLIPSFLIFAPLPNTFYPLPSLIMVCLLMEGLRRNQPAWVVAAGVCMSLMIFMTFTFLPLALLAGLLTLGMYALKQAGSPPVRLAWHWPVQMGVWFGLGLASVWLVLYAATGLGFWDVWVAISRAHLGMDWPYLPWLILHLHDFFMFTGWPLTLLACTGVTLALRQLVFQKTFTESNLMVVAASLTLLILDVSGTLRGESGRVLLFLAPWLLLVAAYGQNGDRKLGAVLTGAQALMVLALVVCIRTIDTDFGPFPNPPNIAVAAPPGAPIYPSGATFGDFVRLEGFAGQVENHLDSNGRSYPVLVLWLHWKAVGTTKISYYYAALPVAPDGTMAPAANIQQPFGQRFPTICWQPDDTVLQSQLEVPLFKTQTGDWWVSLSLVDGDTGHILPVHKPDGSLDHQVGLGPFH